MLDITCPKCERRLQVPEDSAQSSCLCPDCGFIFSPTESATTPQGVPNQNRTDRNMKIGLVIGVIGSIPPTLIVMAVQWSKNPLAFLIVLAMHVVIYILFGLTVRLCFLRNGSWLGGLVMLGLYCVTSTLAYYAQEEDLYFSRFFFAQLAGMVATILIGIACSAGYRVLTSFRDHNDMNI